MSEFARRLICMLGFLLVLGAPLRAQENLDFGKTPAQLFASDCAICHKSPQGWRQGRRHARARKLPAGALYRQP